MGVEILDMAGEAEMMSDEGEGSGGFSPGMGGGGALTAEGVVKTEADWTRAAGDGRCY